MLTNKQRSIIIWLFLIFVGFRLISFGLYPLMDKTESRYAEIGREMLVTNNWITPMLEDKPFLAKPPLSTWALSASFKVFGMNDFAARFPSMIFCLLTLLLCFVMVKKIWNENLAFLASFILLTTGIFYVLTGGVMTDPSLLFTTTLGLSSFLIFMKTKEKKWSYLMFLGMGLSCLAKGPIGLIFILAPIFCWALIFKEFKNIFIFNSITFWGGFLLFCVVALPWYILAEIKTPGFLQYFIVGEHFYRYTMRHWTGDLYGNPSPCPLGMIWVYAFATLMPWIFIFFGKIFRNKDEFKKFFFDKNLMFLVLWALIPMFLFTLSKNVLLTYTLTITPAFAVLAAYFLAEKKGKKEFNFKKFIGLSAIFPTIILIAIIILQIVPSIGIKNSQKILCQKYSDHKIYYLNEIPYSARFYSNGNVGKLSQEITIEKLLQDKENYYFVGKKTEYDRRIAPEFRQYFKIIDKIDEYLVLKKEEKLVWK